MKYIVCLYTKNNYMLKKSKARVIGRDAVFAFDKVIHRFIAIDAHRDNWTNLRFYRDIFAFNSKKDAFKAKSIITYYLIHQSNAKRFYNIKVLKTNRTVVTEFGYMDLCKMIFSKKYKHNF